MTRGVIYYRKVSNGEVFTIKRGGYKIDNTFLGTVFDRKSFGSCCYWDGILSSGAEFLLACMQ